MSDEDRCEEFGGDLAAVILFMYALGYVLSILIDGVREWLSGFLNGPIYLCVYVPIGIGLALGGAYLGILLLKRIYRKYRDLIRCDNV